MVSLNLALSSIKLLNNLSLSKKSLDRESNILKTNMDTDQRLAEKIAYNTYKGKGNASELVDMTLSPQNKDWRYDRLNSIFSRVSKNKDLIGKITQDIENQIEDGKKEPKKENKESDKTHGEEKPPDNGSQVGGRSKGIDIII